MSVVEQPEQHAGSGSEQSGQMRVRDLLRACGTTRDRGERAGLLARLADELEHTADDIAADHQRAQQYQQVIAGLRGQAGMARVAAAFDEPDHIAHPRAC